MPEGHSSGEHEQTLWQGLKSLIFGEEDTSLREQLEDAIDAHEGDPAPDAKGDLSPLERQMVRNLLHFGEQTAGDVGVPRADVIAVEEGIAFDELVRVFADAGHSRLPVYRGELDAIIGMVHIKDVFCILAKGEAPPASIAGLIREPLFVPMSRRALDLLADMRSKRVHLAIVLDEYSGTEGLVTIEDLIEEIVGDIEDEHDDAPVQHLIPLTAALEADGRTELDELGEAVDPRLAESEEDVDTLGGLAAVLAGHVPEPGDCIAHPSGWQLEVIAADPKRVSRVRLHPPRAVPEEVDA